ncbi:MAG: DUF7352 domain-containing protein [Candidatus Thorarchaeota archaeon]
MTDLADYVDIRMKCAAKILSIQRQGEGLYIWALVDTEQNDETRRFRVADTGHPIVPLGGVRLQEQYLDTILLEDYSLVFHIFDFGKLLEYDDKKGILCRDAGTS